MNNNTLNDELEADVGWNKSLLPYGEGVARNKIQWNVDFLDVGWNRAASFSHYLRIRAENGKESKYWRKVFDEISAASGIFFPSIPDAVLFSLADAAQGAAYDFHIERFGDRNPYGPTPHENKLLGNLHRRFSTDSGVEIYPALDSADRRIKNKLAIGIHVPDIVVFGLHPKGVCGKPVATVIEVDGVCHNYKSKNDSLLHSHLESLGFFIWSISNRDIYSKSHVASSIRKILDEMVPADPAATLNLKRRVAFRTIATYLEFGKSGVYDRLGRRRSSLSALVEPYNIAIGFQLVKSHPKCPRVIKYDCSPGRIIDASQDFTARNSFTKKRPFILKVIVRKGSGNGTHGGNPK